MANVVPVGEPVNDTERQAIAHLRDTLPDAYTILHNFEIVSGDERFEVDLAILAPHAVYLVDVKGTQGLIEVHGSRWYPQGRQPFASPLLKLRGHARTLKGLITESQPGRRDLEDLYVDAAVLLAGQGAQLVDPTDKDKKDVVTLAASAAFFKDATRIPARFSRSILGLHGMVRAAIQGKARPRSGPLQFGNWTVAERLGATDDYTEYRAVNTFAGPRAGSVLLRVYKADPYLPEPEREKQQSLISNAFQALNRLPGHPNIVAARDFFSTEGGESFVFVTEDTPGQALRLHMERPALALTLDQKLRLAGELLSALTHLHEHGVVHRNLTPGTILLGADGRTRVTGFDFARAGVNRSSTIAGEIADELETAYLAWEVYLDPAEATFASDIYSAGLILYELFSGERPFADQNEAYNAGAQFPTPASQHRSNLPPGLDDWLQALCGFEPRSRPTAGAAAANLAALTAAPQAQGDGGGEKAQDTPGGSPPAVDYSHLATGHTLNQKFVVERRLGRAGSFGVVYKVIDTLGDVPRAVKLIVRDRHSTLERLKLEYRTLLAIPSHPHVVRVVDANVLPPDNVPMIVFEFVEGSDVSELIEAASFTPEDALVLAKDTVDGLVHLHSHGVFHCDIKPSNLIWTRSGVRIIDFNVAVQPAQAEGQGGGSRRYLPPDLDFSAPPQPDSLTDRDLYALGITLYEAVTRRYPWESATATPGQPGRDPRKLTGLDDLDNRFVDVILRMIAPRRADRFASAKELNSALAEVRQARRPRQPTEIIRFGPLFQGDQNAPPNTNPYVSQLLTLYSQSKRTNAGTRGLDDIGKATYIDTLLDTELRPAVLRGDFKLLIITGNAGDGKTAFLQQLEEAAQHGGATGRTLLANGSRFSYQGITFITNYDGSQDAGDHTNDEVLRQFFEPYQGMDASAWPDDEIRLIAINEGRLVDFLATHAAHYAKLREVVQQGLADGRPIDGIAVVNLNLRSVVAEKAGPGTSLIERLIRTLTHPEPWRPCESCDLRDRCFVFHNARTFQDEVAGPKVIERLKTLYSLTHLRGKQHITLRDLRSALAFMLVGTRDCAEIHELYHTGRRKEILQGYYFNSWMGGDAPNADRLLTLLKEIDVGKTSDPQLDRTLIYASPEEDRALFTFADRDSYDRDLLRKEFEELPTNLSAAQVPLRGKAHQLYLGMLRRRMFFERRDADWRRMLPFRSAERMQELIENGGDRKQDLTRLIRAINRGEGLGAPERLSNKLAVRVRHVPHGTIRSYRLFPAERFSLDIDDAARRAPFVEHSSKGLVLTYRGEKGAHAQLPINLDVFEMLERLNEGYRPSIDEEQGIYTTLGIFKNILGSEPYQEVLLTITGHDFYSVERRSDRSLVMRHDVMEKREDAQQG